MYDKDTQEHTQVDVAAEAPASLQVLTDDELAAICGGDDPWGGNY